MKKISYKLFILTIATGLLASSCYKKFDTNSYAPAFVISGFTGVGQIQPSNLVGYWSFDGSLVDSVSGTAGTNANTGFTGGFKGQGMQGGLNNYVLATPSASILPMGSFTISFWVKTPPPSAGIIGLFSLSRTNDFWGNIEMFFENGGTNAAGKFRTHIFNGTNDHEFASDGLLNLFDNWVNITATYDGASSTYKLYANGSNVSTVTSAGFGPLHITSPGKIVFGTAQFMTVPSQTGSHGAETWASFLTGQMDELRIYKSVLTPTEINAMVVLQGKGK